MRRNEMAPTKMVSDATLDRWIQEYELALKPNETGPGILYALRELREWRKLAGSNK